MAKILAQAGISLADVYDVVGSIAGVSQLLSQEGVGLQHEMGGTLFSERLRGNIERLTTGDLAQNVTWDLTFTIDPGIHLYRVLGVYVQADAPARVTQAQVSLRSAEQGRELPIFIWDSTNDVDTNIRVLENGAAVTSDFAMMQTRPQAMPSLGISGDQRTRVGDEIVFRGLTSGFGAGTVEVVALFYLAFPSFTSSVSSRGLPLPAW